MASYQATNLTNFLILCCTFIAGTIRDIIFILPAWQELRVLSNRQTNMYLGLDLLGSVGILQSVVSVLI